MLEERSELKKEEDMTTRGTAHDYQPEEVTA